MATNTKTYIGVVSTVGTAAIFYALLDSTWPHEPLRFGIYLLLALLASTLKLRLPGLTGTLSIGFVVVLLGIADLSLAETMLIACTGALVQCYWRTLRRPTPIQVMFNLAATAISVVLAYQCARLVELRSHGSSVMIPMAVATCIYFVAGSLLVSGVLSRIESKSLRTIWERCYLLSCPYYLLGGLIAGLVAASSKQVGWQPALLILPVMSLAYLFYRIYLTRLSLGSPIAAER